MKKIICSTLAMTLFCSTINWGPAYAQSNEKEASSGKPQYAANVEKALLLQARQNQLRMLQTQLAEEKQNALMAASINSIILAIEVYVGVLTTIGVVNKAYSRQMLASLTALITAHVSYLTLSPRLASSETEKKIKEEIEKLQRELDAP